MGATTTRGMMLPPTTLSRHLPHPALSAVAPSAAAHDDAALQGKAVAAAAAAVVVVVVVQPLTR